MTLGPAVDMPASSCPFCGKQFDLASSARNGMAGKPKPGDLTLCIQCARVLFFDDALRPRKPVSGELEAAMAEDSAFAERITTVQSAIRKVSLSRNGRSGG
jgi:hypothetical protein